jgi:hypothetical protein
MNMKPLTNDSPAAIEEIDDRRIGSDRREAPRKKVLRGARAVWPNGDSTECVVYNLSDTGAHLELRGPAPNTFDLVVDGEQYPRSCRVVWRRANRTGVKFQGLTPFARMPADSTSKISACREYAETCRALANRVEPSDRDILLKMADAWEKVTRHLRITRTR